MLDNLSVCKKISSWLSVCGETKYGKSGGMAGKLRDQVTGCPIQMDLLCCLISPATNMQHILFGTWDP